MKTISIDGKKWEVIATGAEIDGETVVHLASVTEGTQQKNGFVPKQRVDRVPTELLEED